MTGEESSIQNYFDESIDVHHVYPQKWCREQGIEPARCDSIINKTPLTARTNRSIGGDAPSEYLKRIAAGGIPRDVLDGYLQSHHIAPELMWSDDFPGYFSARQSALLDQIRAVMGKQIASDNIEELDEAPEEYELVQEDSLASGSGDTLLNALMERDGSGGRMPTTVVGWNIAKSHEPWR